MAKSVDERVAEWIRAEYAFRYGPHAYQRQETDEIIKAERKLRRALTGEGDLESAFEALNGQRPQQQSLHK